MPHPAYPWRPSDSGDYTPHCSQQLLAQLKHSKRTCCDFERHPSKSGAAEAQSTGRSLKQQQAWMVGRTTVRARVAETVNSGPRLHQNSASVAALCGTAPAGICSRSRRWDVAPHPPSRPLHACIGPSTLYIAAAPCGAFDNVTPATGLRRLQKHSQRLSGSISRRAVRQRPIDQLQGAADSSLNVAHNRSLIGLHSSRHFPVIRCHSSVSLSARTPLRANGTCPASSDIKMCAGRFTA